MSLLKILYITNFHFNQEIKCITITEYCSLWCDFLQEGKCSLFYMWARGQVDLQWHISCLLEAVLMLLSSACRSMQLCCVGLSWWPFPVLIVEQRCSVQAQQRRCRPLTSPGETWWLLYLSLPLSLSSCFLCILFVHAHVLSHSVSHT